MESSVSKSFRGAARNVQLLLEICQTLLRNNYSQKVRSSKIKENVDGSALKTPQNEHNFKNVLKTTLHKKPFSRITLYADFITVVRSILAINCFDLLAKHTLNDINTIGRCLRLRHVKWFFAITYLLKKQISVV